MRRCDGKEVLAGADVVMPPSPHIFHITHVDNLTSIVRDGLLLSDASMIARGSPRVAIGMSTIKQRRLSLPVKCHAGDAVGQYVPFYFCPRSVMLYIICRANHPELEYKGGQGPIIHLEADLRETIDWADSTGRLWAFTLSNAGAAYAEFRDRLDQLGDVNWDAVSASDFSSQEVKEGKQAEFLVRESFPLHLVRRIGVRSASVGNVVLQKLSSSPSRPLVEVRPDWYF